MRLNHNLMSLGIYRTYTKTLTDSSTALERISSGKKINRAKDGANKVGQSELLKVQIRGLDMAKKNTEDGASMMQTADSALDSITNALQRIKELTIRAANDSCSDEDKKAIQLEIDQMKEHINTTARDTEFNGIKLLDDKKSYGPNDPVNYNMMSGANVSENIQIPMYCVNTNNLGSVEGHTVDDINALGTRADIEKSISVADKAISEITSIRSKYGALQNRFENAANNNEEISEVTQQAESTISDTDIALEMLEYSKSSILINSSIAMMAQSNNFPQDALKVLERVK